MEFKAIQKADVRNINDFLNINKDVDVEVCSANMTVEFTAEIDAGRTGIDGIIASVTSVIGDIDWYVCPDELTEHDKAHIIAAGGVEMRSGNFEGSFPVYGDSWKIDDDDFRIDEYGCLFVNEVEIDCKSKMITVS